MVRSEIAQQTADSGARGPGMGAGRAAQAGGSPPVGPIAGGFVLVPVPALIACWRACRSRPLGIGDFRAWLACRELVARRCRLPEGCPATYSALELASLLGVSGRAARASIRRLAKSGHLEWSGTAIGFPGPAGEADGAGLDAIGRGRGDLVVPRRILRALVGGARPALVATALGLLLRCLSRRKAGFDGRGRLKASWVAETFRLDVRGVKAARKGLVALGWVAPEPSAQAVENRWGRAYRIDLAWTPAVPGGGRHSPPPPAEDRREIATPSLDQEPPREGNQDQEPGEPGGGTGVEVEGGGTGGRPGAAHMGSSSPKACPGLRRGPGQARGGLHPGPGPAGARPAPGPPLPAPRLADIRPEDLANVGRALELHRQAAARGLIGSSEADRLKFLTSAEHARSAGRSNPCGLMAETIRRGWWRYASQADEDAARGNLRRHLWGEPVTVPGSGGLGSSSGGVAARPVRPAGGASLSADARLVREVRAALSRSGYRGDPFPALRRQDASWTRVRWDAAAAELGPGWCGG